MRSRVLLSLLLAAIVGCDSGVAPGQPSLRFATIHSGYYSTCALKATGEAYCWGQTTAGIPTVDSVCSSAQLPCRTTPAPILTSLRFRDFRLPSTAFGTLACGLTTEPATYCWGFALTGQDGGWSIGTLPPTPIAPGLVFDSIAVGSRHMCGLTASHQSYCWGDYRVGVRGTGVPLVDPFILPDLTPNLVAGNIAFQSLAVGLLQSCGLDLAGQAYCWGSFRTLGAPGAPLDSESACGFTIASFGPCADSPQPVAGNLTFSSLAAGEFHTCGLTTIGDIFCWGDNALGELGTGDTVHASSPVRALVSGTATQITAGGSATCALLLNQHTVCWGDNYSGHLGIGSAVPFAMLPMQVATSTAYVAVSLGIEHGCGLDASGQVECWGSNFLGALGTGDLNNSTVPRKVVQ